MPLRVVSTNNQIITGSEARNSFQTVYSHMPYVIGSGDVNGIKLSDIGWTRTTAATVDFTNPITIDAAVLHDNISYVPVYKGGSRTWVIAAGANDSQCDTILPSALGLSKFTLGATYWWKARITLSVAGHNVPFANGRHTGSRTNTQAWWVNPVNTTVSTVDAPGPFTYTGTAPDARTNTYCPIMLGTFVTGDPMTVFGAGDSIHQGQGDSTGILNGFGIFQRAMHDDNTAARQIASINFNRIGGASNGFNSATNDRCAWWSQYCNVGVLQHGTNDFGTNGTGLLPATMLTSNRTTYAKLRGYGVQKLVQVKIGPRTSSTDAFATELNQTATGAGWLAGGDVDLYNTALNSELGVYVDAIAAAAAGRGIDPFKWASPGSTTDGTHPSAAIHAARAVELRAILDTIAASMSSGGNDSSSNNPGKVIRQNVRTKVIESLIQGVIRS